MNDAASRALAEWSPDAWKNWWEDRGNTNLSQVLFWRWDPLGVADDFPSTRGEYDAYVPAIAELLQSGAGEVEVDELLRSITFASMGYVSHLDRSAAAAAFIWSWFQEELDLTYRDRLGL